MDLWVTFGSLHFIQIYLNKFLFQFFWKCLKYPKMTLASTRQNTKIDGREFGHVQPLMWQHICLCNMVNCQCRTIFWAANTIYSVEQHPMAWKKTCDDLLTSWIAYHKGLNGLQAIWANRKHQVLPNLTSYKLYIETVEMV